MSISDWSTAKIGDDPIPDHLYNLSQPSTLAEDVSMDDTEAKERYGIFFDGYYGNLSKPYPTKGVKSYETFPDGDRLTAAIADRAKSKRRV